MSRGGPTRQSDPLFSAETSFYSRKTWARVESQRGFSRQPGLFPVSVTSVVLAEMLSCVSR